MIKDEGCQTNSHQAIAFVSYCQEWFIWNEVFNGKVNDAPVDLRPFFRKMDKLQQTIHNTRFRTYGELRPDGSECIVLVTEFKEFDENTEFWRKVELVQKDTDAHLWVMGEGFQIDYSWRGTDDEGNRIGERFGPNHGKTYKQIEFSWRVENLSFDEIDDLAYRMAQKTETLWSEAGVSVC